MPTTDHVLNHEIISATGAQQGDPISSLLFSLTIQPILEKLSSELNQYRLLG